jgi:hypothetical protein
LIPRWLDNPVLIWVRQPNVPAEGILRQAAVELFHALEVERKAHPELYDASYHAVVDELEDIGRFCDIPPDKAQKIFVDAKGEIEAPKPNGAGHAGPRTQPREWPDPCPVPEALLPVSSLALDLLPEKLRPWAEDIVDRMQCPIDYLGVSAEPKRDEEPLRHRLVFRDVRRDVLNAGDADVPLPARWRPLSKEVPSRTIGFTQPQ